MSCPLCIRIEEADFTVKSELACAFGDAFPLSPGHTLIASRRHESDYFGLSDEEREALWGLVPRVRAVIEIEHSPDGYNIGLNVGTAAGQTIEHVHLHVIPRYKGDVPDPRGGIRWVLPERAPYWER